MKKFTQILIAAVAFSLALSASAQTTLSTIAASVRDSAAIEDQSKLPSQENRIGYMSALYDVEVLGGSGAVEFGPALPDNCAVVGGRLIVVEAVLPATATNALHLQTANDLLAAGTTLQSTGLKTLAAGSYETAPTLQYAPILTNVFNNVTNVFRAVTNVSSTTVSQSLLSQSPIVTTDATRRATATWTGATATQGVFFVVLDLVKLQ